MEWHTRLTTFLLMCFFLIGFNIIATISGIYDAGTKHESRTGPQNHNENMAKLTVYP